jgi:hypothetical protein
MSNSINSVLEKAFLQNFTNAKNSSNTFSLRDNTFYSYNEPIAKKIDNIVVIYPKTASTGQFFSSTTSKHIGNIKRYCDLNNIDNYIGNE